MKHILLLCVLLILITFYDNIKADSQVNPCGDNWHRLGDKCYSLIADNQLHLLDLTFEKAENACKQQDATSNLPIIRNQDEQNLLFNYLNSTWEQGNNITGYWLGAKSEKLEFHWLDNTALNYTNWANGFPLQLENFCAEMILTLGDHWPPPYSSGKWFNEQCSEERKVICQKLPSTTIFNTFSF